MNYRVVYSAEGFDNSAYFDTASECDIFARMMADGGRLVRVVADGLDITDKFVTFVTFADLAKR